MTTSMKAALAGAMAAGVLLATGAAVATTGSASAAGYLAPTQGGGAVLSGQKEPKPTKPPKPPKPTKA